MSIPTQNPKYRQLIDAGHALFWKYGVKRVTVEEICREAGVSKMTYYKFFSNKAELAKTVLEIASEESMQKYRKIMAEDIPFSQKIEKTLMLKLEGIQGISEEFLKDIYHNQKMGLMPFLTELQERSLKEILGGYLEAQEKGWIRKDLKPAFIVYFLGKMREMLADEYLLHMYETPQELIMEMTRFFFYGLGVNDQPDNE